MTAEPGDPAAIEAALLDAVKQRGTGRTICPSEVARALCPHDWRPLMPAVRAAAARLAARGELRVTRGGKPVGALEKGGPIRLSLALPSPDPKP